MFVHKLLPAALGLWIGFTAGTSRGQEALAVPTSAAVPVQEPGRLALDPGPIDGGPSLNQRMADAIAERLQLSGRLRGYRVDIRFAEGIAELSGRVADLAQRDEVLRIVQAHPGVERVRDLLQVGASGVLLTAQGQKVEQGPLPGSLEGPQEKTAVGEDKGLVVQPPRGQLQEPVSIMSMTPGFNPAMPNSAMQQPPLPPNAWPTYAPYNNYSRVAYPTLYPHEAFPFVGPMYPFPKVPLGWRAITLEWQDGHWWYGKKATGHDWWRIRYW